MATIGKIVLLFHAFIILTCVKCQVHYVPAQILIPTINGSHVAFNHSIYQPPQPALPPPQIYNPVNPQFSSYGSNNNNSSTDGHLILGTIHPYDRLLFNQDYYKPGHWWNWREKIVEYPKDLPAGYSRHEIISALRISNKFLDGNTAKATLVDGGIGRRYAKIKLESGFGKGFRYNVQIFGH